MLLNKKLKFFKKEFSFLLKNSNNFNFFIFNIIDLKNKKYLLEFFGYGNVFHISYFRNIYLFSRKLNGLFSGNVYLCFFNVDNIFEKFIDFITFFSNINGVYCLSFCYNNFFFNLNFNYLNLFNVIFTNVIFITYVYLINLYYFFFKFVYYLRLKINKC